MQNTRLQSEIGDGGQEVKESDSNGVFEIENLDVLSSGGDP